MPKRNGILPTLGLNVRRAREAKEFTQEKLAERASLDPTWFAGGVIASKNIVALYETVEVAEV